MFLLAVLVASVVDAASYEQLNGTVVDPILDRDGNTHAYSGNNLGFKADLRSASLSGADLISAYLTRADLSYADLSYADLRYADLDEADLIEVDLTGANLYGANLRYAYLVDANLTDADLTDADVRDAFLFNANLRNADLTSANIWFTDLRYANLSSAKLTNVSMGSSRLNEADLTDADLRGATLGSTDLSSADLTNSDLRYADLLFANLKNADLTGSNLSNAYLDYAYLDNVIFSTGTILYDNQTVLQLGFDESGLETYLIENRSVESASDLTIISQTPLTDLIGDANRDGMVSADDYASVQSNFGNTNGSELAGDANDDGVVSANDYASVQSNFGNTAGFQAAASAAIAGIGKDTVDDAGAIPGTTPHVQLDVPALLGTLTTPDGLGAANLEATSVGLLNVVGDAFLSDPPTPISEVNLIPEPASLGLLSIGTLLILGRRRRRTFRTSRERNFNWLHEIEVRTVNMPDFPQLNSYIKELHIVIS